MTAAAIKEYLPCPFNQNEAAIAQLAADGKTAREIAFMLGMPLYTVNYKVMTARRKAQADTLPHLVAISLRHGWVD